MFLFRKKKKYDMKIYPFYLHSVENHIKGGPYKCEYIKPVPLKRRIFIDRKINTWMLVKLTPPLDGKNIGIPGFIIYEVCLSERHYGESLWTPNKYHICVYVIIKKQKGMHIRMKCVKREGDLYFPVGWGEVHKTRDDAIKYWSVWNPNKNE